MELNQCINFLLTRAQNTVQNHFRDKLAGCGVTPVQYAILKLLWDEDELSPTQLSSALGLNPSTITGLIDRMERKGLVQRIHSDTDRRAIMVRILPLGLQLRPAIEKTILEANLEVLQGIDPQDIDTLKNTLQTIVEQIEQHN